jgi:hypothetical protein
VEGKRIHFSKEENPEKIDWASTKVKRFLDFPDGRGGGGDDAACAYAAGARDGDGNSESDATSNGNGARGYGRHVCAN